MFVKEVSRDPFPRIVNLLLNNIFVSVKILNKNQPSLIFGVFQYDKYYQFNFLRQDPKLHAIALNSNIQYVTIFVEKSNLFFY